MWFAYVGDAMVPIANAHTLGGLLEAVAHHSHYAAAVAAGKLELRWDAVDMRPAIAHRGDIAAPHRASRS